MPTLKITATQGGSAVTVDVSAFLKLNEGDGADPYDPAYTTRVFARSLLKEGATLALQQLVEKEQTWPLLIGPFSTQTAMLQKITQINQVIATPGAVVTWQDDGTSQPTYFDLLSGELQIQYSFRKAQQVYTEAKLLLFSQPLGRIAGPRPYAAASGVGPLLMISPYASGGALAIGASTQAGVAGFGGAPMGASSGVFYAGAPSLGGDAPALLQVSYVGPLPKGASFTGTVPYVAVSLLPDPLYRPLVTAAEMTNVLNTNVRTQQTAVGSQYVFMNIGGVVGFKPLPVASYSLQDPTSLWAGNHRLLAIARASMGVGTLQTLPNTLVPNPTTASVLPGDWALYDLGTFSLRASEMPNQQVTVTCAQALTDIAALVMLPDSTTWFLPPTQIVASQYGWPQAFAAQAVQVASAPWTNTVLIDDVLGDQFLYSGQSQSFAPSPLGSVPSSARLSQYTRGVVPRPDPKNGMPIVAVLGVGQMGIPSTAQLGPSASWANPQNLQTMAQVNVLERTRYVLP